MKYINSEKLIAEIERQLRSIENATGDYAEGRRCELENLRKLITSLQQEQQEADLEKEIKIARNDDRYLVLNKGRLIEEIARHFAEWGAIHLNSSKGE